MRWTGLASVALLAMAACSDDAPVEAPTNGAAAIAEAPADSEADDGPPIVSPTPAPGSAAVSIPPPPREGRWFVKDDGDGPAAIFGPPESDGSMSVRCDADGARLIFFRAADPDDSAPVAMNLFLPTGNTLLRAFPSRDGELGFYGRMPLRAPWIDTLLAADGTLESDLDGRAPLSLPVAPELKQVVAQCRSAAQKRAP